MPTLLSGRAMAPGAVQTLSRGALLDSRRCPVCHTNPLTGRRQVCSVKCRADRWRQRREEGWLSQGSGQPRPALREAMREFGYVEAVMIPGCQVEEPPR